MKLKWYWRLRDWEQPLWVPGYTLVVLLILGAIVVFSIVIKGTL